MKKLVIPKRYKASFTPKLYWFLHHRVLLETTTEPVRERLSYIMHHKPHAERPVRLRCLKAVRHYKKLPAEVRKAFEAWRDERVLDQRLGSWYNTIMRTYSARPLQIHSAWCSSHLGRFMRKLDTAIRKNIRRLMALHRKEHPNAPVIYRKRMAELNLS